MTLVYHADHGILTVLKYEDMTREERTELMLTDLPAYMKLLSDEHYFQLFDGIAKLGEYQPEEDE